MCLDAKTKEKFNNNNNSGWNIKEKRSLKVKKGPGYDRMIEKVLSRNHGSTPK